MGGDRKRFFVERRWKITFHGIAWPRYKMLNQRDIIARHSSLYIYVRMYV